MRKLSRSQIIPSLVKEVEITSAHPGYRYVYFKSFEEINEYFTQECGENWRDQEWAQFWIRNHVSSVLKDKRRSAAQTKTKKQAYHSDHTKQGRPFSEDSIPAHILKALIDKYRSQNMSLRQISEALKTNDSIDMAFKTIANFLKRHGDAVQE